MFGIGMQELLIILVLVLVIFGREAPARNRGGAGPRHPAISGRPLPSRTKLMSPPRAGRRMTRKRTPDPSLFLSVQGMRSGTSPLSVHI